MKQVTIINKVIPAESRSKYGTSGRSSVISGGASVDLSPYLLKAIWERNFEERKDEAGNEYIYIKKPIVGAAGLTTFAGDEIKVDSIFKGLPIDTETLQWVDGVLTVVGGGTGGGASNWDELKGKPSWITDTKPTYAWGEITQKPTTLSGYGIQASDVLNVLKTVDGSGSGLDADTLDGKHYIDIINGNVASATKLQTARTIWGQSFDGTANITGSLTSVTDITGTGTFTGANIKATDSVYVNGIRLHKTVDGAVTIEGNLLVTGGITAHADGEDSGGTGGGVIVIDNLTSTLTDAALSANQGRVLKDLIDSKVSNWGELEGKPTTIAGYGITDAYTKTECDDRYFRYLGGSTGDSDTYWQKLGFKNYNQGFPDGLTHKIYGYGQVVTIGNGNWACLELYSTDIQESHPYYSKNGLQFRTGWDSNRRSWRMLLDEVNYASYVDNRYVLKSGDTITGKLIIKSSGGGNQLIINNTSGGETYFYLQSAGVNKGAFTTMKSTYGTCIYDATSQKYLGINTDGTPHFQGKTLWHEGNDGSGSGLDADMLDGVHNGNLTAAYTHNGALQCFRTATKPDNGGRQSYVIIADCTDTVNAESGGSQYGFTGIIIGRRNDGYPVEYVAKVVIRIGYNIDGLHLYTDSSKVVPYILKKDSNYYLALKTYSSTHQLYFYGFARNLLSTFTYVNTTDANGTLPSGYSIAYYGSGMEIYGNATSATKLQTTRTIWGQSFNGTANVSGSLTGVTNITASGSISCGSLRTTDISGNGSSLYIGNSNNSSYVYLREDMKSSNGNWSIPVNGNATFASATINGALTVPYSGGQWISMATRSNVIQANQNQSQSSAHVLFRVKSYNGNAVCFGGLNNRVGFYGFTASDISSGTNNIQWTTAWNTENGYFGIGTDTPSQRLHVSGNILAAGGGTFHSSDIRAKTIIERPKLSLNSIANAPVIKFRWNGYNGLKDDNKLHVGGIAQYIEKILPECVIGQKGDFLSFDYATTGYIFSVLTARHLLSYETRTDRIIRKLKERIKRLERQLNIENHEEVCIVAD